MKIVIGHLYPDLLNLYGDNGNIITLQYRLRSRGIEAEVKTFCIEDDIDFSALDIILIGGGSDREQLLVCNRLRELKNDIIDYAEDGGVILAVCGGYQLLGKYYKMQQETIQGIGLLDIYTDQGEDRLIGNVVLRSDLTGSTVVGFENHGGRTYIGDHTPLGKVLYGFGNNGSDGHEGVVYKNVIATYLHGPLLPKNPLLADYIIKKAIERRYGEFDLAPIDDTMEMAAHNYVVGRFVNK